MNLPILYRKVRLVYWAIHDKHHWPDYWAWRLRVDGTCFERENK